MKKILVLLAVVTIVSVVAAACVDLSSSAKDATPTHLQATAVPVPITSPAPTAPPVPSGSPLSTVILDGVEYFDSSAEELPSGEGAVIVIDGFEIDLDDLELVGTSTGLPKGVQVYRSKVSGDANAVYTFAPARSILNPEDGRIREFPALLVRWTTR